MKKSRIKLPLCKQYGIALIENLIAIALLTVGALGIAASTATSIKVNGDNQARAMALAVATKELEPLYVTALEPGTDHKTFSDVIGKFVAEDAVLGDQGQISSPANAGVTTTGNVAADNSDDFIISISQAVDAGGKNVLTTAGPYTSPINIAVLVTYQGNAGHAGADGTDEISETKQFTASYTYVLAP